MSMTTTIERFTQWVRKHLQSQYNALMGMLSNPVELLECFEDQPGNKALGIDKISKSDYADGVVDRIKTLSANLRSLSYQPKPSRRVYIPKGNGKSRPLGIPCFEDRIVQQQLCPGYCKRYGSRNLGNVPTDSVRIVMRIRHWQSSEKSSSTKIPNG